ncbi:transcriptional regulator [Candidatus Collierbacteria bacterium CG10_big_fil_rev_8_21_14_0_10_43_36]|uniref:Transcriptional regulator n=1 Tax=Candidatus Collierbacteria bacterium CG10_big_fil_rev_8_21_14_0_10_43_36 TaxID=1974534 RepID=A0A2H0VJV9_9BACT|nr:winged helix-turn-helix transcriptional regulator [bacterium]PIR99366.1 MAG: transcriptional regulator [Candidatus Collierbacteria bacterium CG10_big_fil_rev_8_21_14_0_10_43_36]
MGSYKCCPDNKIKSEGLEELSSILKLVSDNNRLQLLCILQNGEHCVCQLLDHTKLSQSLISHHLKDLKDAGLVVDRKDSKWSYYSLTKDGLEIINLLLKIKI